MSKENEQKIHLPNWQIKETHPHLIEPLLTAFKEVYDPEIRLNVIDLGLIRDISIGSSEAQITMILTTPFCPYGPMLMEAVREKAEEVLQTPTKMNLGNEYWTQEMMAEEFRTDWGLFQ